MKDSEQNRVTILADLTTMNSYKFKIIFKLISNTIQEISHLTQKRGLPRNQKITQNYPRTITISTSRSPDKTLWPQQLKHALAVGYRPPSFSTVLRRVAQRKHTKFQHTHIEPANVYEDLATFHVCPLGSRTRKPLPLALVPSGSSQKCDRDAKRPRTVRF